MKYQDYILNILATIYYTMAAKDFVWGNPRPEQEPNKYKWYPLPLKNNNMKVIMESWENFLNEVRGDRRET